jgi:hypothetical protein
MPQLSDYKPNWPTLVPAIIKIVIALGTAILVLKLTTLPGNEDGRKAQDFCQSLIPALENYRRAHGSYPSAVEAVLPIGTPLPVLLYQQGLGGHPKPASWGHLKSGQLKP